MDEFPSEYSYSWPEEVEQDAPSRNGLDSPKDIWHFRSTSEDKKPEAHDNKTDAHDTNPDADAAPEGGDSLLLTSYGRPTLCVRSRGQDNVKPLLRVSAYLLLAESNP